MREDEVAYYEDLVRRHRGTPGQVGAGSKRSQEVRFEVMEELWLSMVGEKARQVKLLDFGCGKGDLAAFLDARGGYDVAENYIGIDGVEANIEDARGLGPWDFRLARWDGEGPPVPEPVDLLVFSGALATATEADKLRFLRRMLDHARVGVIGNFITRNARVPELDDDPRTIAPETVLAVVDRARFAVRLRADYKAHDFTIAAIRWEH